jgi:hypothetical protein
VAVGLCHPKNSTASDVAPVFDGAAEESGSKKGVVVIIEDQSTNGTVTIAASSKAVKKRERGTWCFGLSLSRLRRRGSVYQSQTQQHAHGNATRTR